jgi:hypothetical protein
LGVGDSLELPYTLPGPLPAGNYRLVVTGFQDAHDGMLHGEVLYRSGGPDAGAGADGGAYQLVVEADGTPPGAGGGDTYLDVTVQGAAISAACGDTLVYRVTYVAGSEPFYEVFLTLDIP